MAESSSSSFDRTLANIGKCDGFSNFREWEPKIRQAIGLHKPKLLPILDGKRRPTGAANAEAAAEWTEHNNQLFSIPFFMTSESANVTVKTYMSKDVGGMGDGAVAWKAIKERFDGNTKQARRTAREKLFKSTMAETDDPEDFVSHTDRLRDRLKELGETISDEVYESLLLDALPKKFQFIRERHYEDDSLGIKSLKKTAIAYNIDTKARTPSISGRGMAMTSDTGTGSCCKECGHCKTDGPRTKKKWKKGKKGSGDGQPRWCSYHNTTTHTDDECHKPKELRGLAANLALLQSSNNVGSAHLAQQQGSEPSTFGFSFSAMGESLAEASANTSKDETPSTAKQDHHLPGGFFGAF